MNTTLRAAVHIGKDCGTNLRFTKNYLWKTTGQLFREAEKLISGQPETTGISLIKFPDLRWVSTSLLHSRAYQCATAKVYVLSDSVLCLGKMGNNPVESWKKQSQWYSDDDHFSELNRIDGQPMEIEWKFSQDSLQGQSSMRINRWWEKTGRIIFMSMFNDIVWDAKGNDELCENNLKTIKKYAERFPRGHWSFLGLASENKWCGTYACKPDGSCDRIAEKTLLNFAGSDHPPFRGTSALERGELRSKVEGKTSIHFNGSTQNIELLLQMVISVNPLSIYGAVADMIEELPVGQKALGKPAAPGQLDKHEILTQPPLAEVQANEERQGNQLVARIRSTIWESVRRPEVIQTMLQTRFEISRDWTIFLCSSVTKRKRKSIFFAENIRCLEKEKDSYQRVDPKQCTIWPSLGHISLQSLRKIQYWSSSSIFVSRSNRILD